MENFIQIVEIIGIIVFAISGALSGIKHRYDLLGVVIIGVTTATGGGIIRDIVLGISPPISLRNGLNIYIAIIVSLLVFIINLLDENVNRFTVHKLFDSSLVITDALGLAVFTITGMQTAYVMYPYYSTILYIFVGVMSGVGGGLIRDILTNETPYILERHVYASASIIGGIIYHLLLEYTKLNSRLNVVICVGIIFLIRMLAYKNKWNLPKATRVLK